MAVRFFYALSKTLRSCKYAVLRINILRLQISEKCVYRNPSKLYLKNGLFRYYGHRSKLQVFPEKQFIQYPEQKIAAKIMKMSLSD